jgi:hypothetical protein
LDSGTVLIPQLPGTGSAVTHKRKRYLFPCPQMRMNELHVEFDVRDVRAAQLGVFSEAITQGKLVKLSRTTPLRQAVRVEFERDGDFNIIEWHWARGDQ